MRLRSLSRPMAPNLAELVHGKRGPQANQVARFRLPSATRPTPVARRRRGAALGPSRKAARAFVSTRSTADQRHPRPGHLGVGRLIKRARGESCLAARSTCARAWPGRRRLRHASCRPARTGSSSGHYSSVSSGARANRPRNWRTRNRKPATSLAWPLAAIVASIKGKKLQKIVNNLGLQILWEF